MLLPTTKYRIIGNSSVARGDAMGHLHPTHQAATAKNSMEQSFHFCPKKQIVLAFFFSFGNKAVVDFFRLRRGVADHDEIRKKIQVWKIFVVCVN